MPTPARPTSGCGPHADRALTDGRLVDHAPSDRAHIGRCGVRHRRAPLLGHLTLAVVTLVITLGVCSASPVGAAAEVGGGLIAAGSSDGRHPPRRGAGAGDALPTYSAPVDAPVIDPFRAPAGPYGPGNRGLEYRTRPGTVVGSIGAGTVAFAGQVAGRLVISIDHPDGLRSSLVGLAAIDTTVGRRVGHGAAVGRAGSVLHLGVRRHGVYLDPATLFGVRGPARLVPWPTTGDGATGFRPGARPH